jgi:signal transduction histidine kinase
MEEHASPLRIIDIRAMTQGGNVIIAVADTGPGFAQDQAGQIFNAFYTTKAAGMGIGLSVSKTIIEAHDGTISASNRPEGGASFVINLPAAPPV